MFIPGKMSIFALTSKHDEEEMDQDAVDDDGDGDASDDDDDAVLTLTDKKCDLFCERHNAQTELFVGGRQQQPNVLDHIDSEITCSSSNEASDRR